MLSLTGAFSISQTELEYGHVVEAHAVHLNGQFHGDVFVAEAVAAFLSAYVVRVPVMFRQAPITAAIVIASELERHSKIGGVELGLRRVAEVLLGCVVGVAVSWAMAKLWPLSERLPG